MARPAQLLVVDVGTVGFWKANLFASLPMTSISAACGQQTGRPAKRAGTAARLPLLLSLSEN
jgi:hypothetical protein